MKKIGKKAWFTVNLVLPLWEAGRMVHAARYAAEKNAERFRRLKPESTKKETETLSFDEAVAASGQSRESLIRRYLLAKRIWLMMFFMTVGVLMLLPIVTLASELPVYGVFLFRLLSMMFMLAAFASMLFVNAMKNQFRIWQLLNKELGPFTQWRTSQAWIKDVFTWRSPA